MQIDREVIINELEKFISKIFLLPEIDNAQVRDVIIKKNEIRTDKLQEIMDKSYHDRYSDVDLSIMVRINPKDAVTPSEYMERIDRFGINTENCLGIAFVDVSKMYRIILKNGMRYDFGFGFKYDDNADLIHILPREEEYSNPNWPMNNVNRFWFVQIQALAKLYRKDFLIGDHLANMNLNETLVQQMILRDLEYGTNHHRYGYEEELEYLKNMNKCPIKTDNAIFNIISDKLYSAALTYDELTIAFYPNYNRRSLDFFEIWKCYEQGRIE
ncbi:hypothetical protein [Anaeromicropila herbilytica]|uniref:Uncharacterized protein n=1 Tax=Anaeromicropila herbilytica TaxID=2785025 RepID=A0A7R7EL74_9FIRM|nr:hypothetical protein [Anaeromicropila herbilytica]BCN30834.1 hypothetical protein bsdtb5_21290 [Anaeromicropila herbilytica]